MPLSHSDTTSPTPSKEIALRDSLLLPPIQDPAVSDAERTQWEHLESAAFTDRYPDFPRLLVILTLNLVHERINWTAKTLRLFFSPYVNQRGLRYQVLYHLFLIAKSTSTSPSEIPDILTLNRELSQAFLRPILEASHPILQSIWLPSPGIFESTSISDISSALECLGLPSDNESILALRRYILPILPYGQMQSPLSSQLQLYCLFSKIDSELQTPIDRRYVVVIALSNCREFASFLSYWVQTAEAECLLSGLWADFEKHGDSSRLAILLVGYIIHRNYFGAGGATSEIPRLPVRLCQEGVRLFEEATVSFAHCAGLTSMLRSLAPDVNFNMSEGRRQEWDYWHQSYPTNPHMESGTISQPETLHRPQSILNAADVPIVRESPGCWDVLKHFITCCFA